MAGQPTRCPSRHTIPKAAAASPRAGALRVAAVLLGLALDVPDVRAGVQVAPVVPAAQAAHEDECFAAGAPESGVLLPPGFLAEELPLNAGQVTGMAFASDGRLFVWQKSGVVHVIQDGVMQATPVLDISDEVANWGDHGLLAVALDPDFPVNGLLYLYYVVDWHHVETAGTPAYDPDFSLDFHATIARVTRYRCSQINGVVQALPASRIVLLGEDAASGIPICGASHGVGGLILGEDGTLLLSTGDSHVEGGASGLCEANGILQPKEQVGSFRSQLVDSLCGKMLRIHAVTGDGLPSNPFFDPLAPRAARSRVWALGLRNPFRFTVRPGTGLPQAWLGRPGSLMISDVGANTREELSVVTLGGANLGWPLFEGLTEQPWPAPVTANLDAPNPLFGTPGCTQEFLDFQDLLVQDDLPPAPHVIPCNPGILVPASLHTFVHHRPVLDWAQGSGPARAPAHDAGGFATAVTLGTPGAPVSGPSFGGSCASAVAFHPGGGFPPEYTGLMFMADFTGGWIRTVEFDDLDRPTRVEPFAIGTGAVVALDVHPQEGWLYWLDYGALGDTRLMRVRLVTDNEPPAAVATLAPDHGDVPLTVSFDGTASHDPEGSELSWRWEFGDGSFESRLAAPVRTLPSEDISALGEIVTKLDELNPPAPMGFGSKDQQILRDGLLPQPGQNDPDLQYDTLHVSFPGLVSDKGDSDWIGYVFPAPRVFTGLIFQEGLHFGVGGGWFDSLSVQVRQDEVWTEVAGLVIDPPYDHGAEPAYEVFELRFAPVSGDGIRLFGEPGGTHEFISVGELRVLALHEPLPDGPLSVPVTLVVSDDLAQPAVAELVVSLNNHPPVAHILAPQNGSTYPADALTQIPLIGLGTDPDGDATSCTWEVILHHNTHTHPEPTQQGCEGLAVLQPHGGAGDVHYYQVRLTVTDAWGLSSTAVVWLLPDNDLNLNGLPDDIEIAQGLAKDANGNGIPDLAEKDCNQDGLNDAASLVIGLERDIDNDGIPDECDPFFHQVEQKF